MCPFGHQAEEEVLIQGKFPTQSYQTYKLGFFFHFLGSFISTSTQDIIRLVFECSTCVEVQSLKGGSSDEKESLEQH